MHVMQISATVLLRDDGVALAFGDNAYGQCNVPPVPEGRRYSASLVRCLAVQLECTNLSASQATLTCASLAGVLLARMNGVDLATTVSELSFTIGEELGQPGQRIEVVSPSGRLLSNLSEELSLDSLLAAQSANK